MRLRRFITERVADSDAGATGKEFEILFKQGLEMVGLEHSTDREKGWDIKSGGGWKRGLSNKPINIKVSTAVWAFSASELYEMLPWDKMPESYDLDKAAAKVKRFLNKRGINKVIFLKPKDITVQKNIVRAVRQKDKKALNDIFKGKNFIAGDLRGYKVRVLSSNGKRVTSVALDAGGKVFVRSEKPRDINGTITVTFRSPTNFGGKEVSLK